MVTKNKWKAAKLAVPVLAAVMMFSLMVGAGTEPTEPVVAAEARQCAVLHIYSPNIEGTFNHPAWPPSNPGIKALHFDFSIEASVNAGEPNDPWSCRPAFSEITISKEFDKTSPELSYYCALGQHFGSVVISMLPVSPTGSPYYEITLTDAVITRIRPRVVHRETQVGTFAHLEEVSFKCGIITWNNLQYGVIRSWDVLHNEPPQ
jgi:type VI secretion system Hcp family effector